jgi:hypothetical protein
MSIQNILFATVCYFLFSHGIKYLVQGTKWYLDLTPKKKTDFVISATACLNAVLASIGGAAILLNPPTSINSDHIKGYSDESALILTMLCGYFIWDLYICLTKECGVMFVVHGMMGFLLYGYASMFSFMHYWGMVYGLWEVSSIFLNIRTMMKLMNISQTMSRMFYVIELLAFATFGIVRIGYGWMASISWWRESIHHWGKGLDQLAIGVYLASNLAFHYLNLTWFILMMKRAITVFRAQDKINNSSSICSNSTPDNSSTSMNNTTTHKSQSTTNTTSTTTTATAPTPATTATTATATCTTIGYFYDEDSTDQSILMSSLRQRTQRSGQNILLLPSYFSK